MSEQRQDTKESFFSDSGTDAMQWLWKRAAEINTGIYRLGLKPSAERNMAKGKVTAFIVYRKIEAIG